jgi:hypothetical protein
MGRRMPDGESACARDGDGQNEGRWGMNGGVPELLEPSISTRYLYKRDKRALVHRPRQQGLFSSSFLSNGISGCWGLPCPGSERCEMYYVLHATVDSPSRKPTPYTPRPAMRWAAKSDSVSLSFFCLIFSLPVAMEHLRRADSVPSGAAVVAFSRPQATHSD